MRLSEKLVKWTISHELLTNIAFDDRKFTIEAVQCSPLPKFYEQ